MRANDVAYVTIDIGANDLLGHLKQLLSDYATAGGADPQIGSRSSVMQLPWKPEVAWVAANPIMEGEDVAQAPRNVLRRLIDEAAAEGLHVKTGVEAEFFLLTPEGTQISDPYDTAEKPCYDQQAVMRRYDVVAEICDYMLALGWGPYQNDHEDANGQFEMNWEFADALTTADRMVFFKYMVKAIAEKHGMFDDLSDRAAWQLIDAHRRAPGRDENGDPIESIEAFVEEANGMGFGPIDFKPYSGKTHEFYHHGLNGNREFKSTMEDVETFLEDLGWLKNAD